MNEQSRSILLAICGLLFIFIFYFAFSQTRIARLHQIEVPLEVILSQADSVRQASPLAGTTMKRTVRLRYDKDVQRHVLYELPPDSSLHQMPLAWWEIGWDGKHEDESGEKKSAGLSLRYDLRGNLLRYAIKAPDLDLGAHLSEPAAIAAMWDYFATTAFDTTGLVIENKSLKQEGQTSTFNFKLQRPSTRVSGLQENFEVDIQGERITHFSHFLSLDKEVKQKGKAEKLSGDVLGIATAVTVFALAVFFIVVFVRRMRHDELEYRWARWLGLVTFVAMFVGVAIQSYPEWVGVLIGGIMAGVMMGTINLILFATNESASRDIWPEKLALWDVLFRGYLRVRELGIAILNTIFMAGSTLIAVAAFIWITEKLRVGYLQVDPDAYDLLVSPFDTLPNFGMQIFTGLIMSLLLLYLWAAFLRPRLRKNLLYGGVLTLSLAMLAMHVLYIEPTYLSALFVLPLCMLWSYFIIRYDMFTIFAGLTLLYLLHAVVGFGLYPASIGSTTGLLILLLLLAYVTAGVLLSFSNRRLVEIDEYVPEYIGRIAERERMRKELEIARKIQLQFLPQREPEYPHLDISSICKPAMEVGGDYYDFFSDSDRYMSVVVGDVSGKGISAAFYMTMAKGIIQTVARRLRAPRLVMSEVNAVFYENSAREVFISAIYGLFDMQERQLTFARAGHNPLVMHKRKGEQPELLNPRGLAIGLDSGTIFNRTIEETTVPIESGDVFVFYTDGLSEAMDKTGEEFGEERLLQLITQLGEKSAQEVRDTIKREVDRFCKGAEQHDDFTMVVVRVAGIPPEAKAREKAATAIAQE